MGSTLLVIIGPSGSGKTSLAAALERDQLVVVTPTWTTRPRRDDETRVWTNHRFVGEDRFAALVRDGFFVATAEMAGHHYGLPALRRPDDGRIPAVVARGFALPLVDEAYPGAVVYHVEAPLSRVGLALRRRRTAAADRRERLDTYAAERFVGRSLADRVFVNDGSLDALVGEVERALVSDFVSERRTA